MYILNGREIELFIALFVVLGVELTEADLANVSWAEEKDNFKRVGKKVVELLTINEIDSIDDLLALTENLSLENAIDKEWIITWCVGHLVTMSYPEVYDEKLKFWRLDTLPFLPKEYKYEIIPAVKNQFEIVQSLLQREDIEEIYNAGDSGREGEYIQRLVFMMAKPNPNAKINGNMLEDEKAFRTCHFAIGQNYDGDANALIHLDCLVKNPTIVAFFKDGSSQVILSNGNLVCCK